MENDSKKEEKMIKKVFKKQTFILFTFYLFFYLPAYVGSQLWGGKVVSITDGDTIKVMHNGKAEKIRLYGIDTPEMKQAFGKRDKKFVFDKVFKTIVKVVPVDRDRYGRTVAMVYPLDEMVSLNEAIVDAGYAWVYRKYCTANFCFKWLELEQEARNRKRGLWVEDAVPPWEYRKGKGKPGN